MSYQRKSIKNTAIISYTKNSFQQKSFSRAICQMYIIIIIKHHKECQFNHNNLRNILIKQQKYC